jgi:hypothetical protein
VALRREAARAGSIVDRLMGSKGLEWFGFVDEACCGTESMGGFERGFMGTRDFGFGIDLERELPRKAL